MDVVYQRDLPSVARRGRGTEVAVHPESTSELDAVLAPFPRSELVASAVVRSWFRIDMLCNRSLRDWTSFAQIPFPVNGVFGNFNRTPDKPTSQALRRSLPLNHLLVTNPSLEWSALLTECNFLLLRHSWPGRSLHRRFLRSTHPWNGWVCVLSQMRADYFSRFKVWRGGSGDTT
jgi:hypothetical protein